MKFIITITEIDRLGNFFSSHGLYEICRILNDNGADTHILTYENAPVFWNEMEE